MTSDRRSLNLPYRTEDLFELVSDVRRYPEFVKWLHTIRILREETTDTSWTGRAEASVGFKGFSESFTTDIDANRTDGEINVLLVRGPFRKLRNSWRFAPIASGTRVDVTIDFEFRNFILQALADANRDFAVNRLIDSFTAEAARRYRKVVTTV